MTAVDEPAERDQQRWSLDEYVVVADLYLRRGRSSGSNDPEIVDLARMTGRSPAAISRRLGNYRGTEQPGVGLKPVVGEAAEMFWTMKHDDQFRRRVVEEARGRLAARSASMTSLSPPVVAQFVDPEESTVEVGEVVTPATTREMVRAEAQLVRRYREWLDPDRVRLRGIVIDAPATRPAPTSTTPGPITSSRPRQRRVGRSCATPSASSSTTAGISNVVRTWRCSCRSSPTKTSWVCSTKRTSPRSGRPRVGLSTPSTADASRLRQVHPRDSRAAIDLDPTLPAAHTGWTPRGEDLRGGGCRLFP